VFLFAGDTYLLAGSWDGMGGGGVGVCTDMGWGNGRRESEGMCVCLCVVFRFHEPAGSAASWGRLMMILFL
jgi:hypothetical protein